MMWKKHPPKTGWKFRVLELKAEIFSISKSESFDGSEIRQTHQLRLVVEIPLFTGVLYIPGGCLGFCPPTVLKASCHCLPESGKH